MRSRFDEQLACLNRELTTMGAMCEEAIALVAKALTDGDRAIGSRMTALDRDIDQMERDIEALCLKLLLQQQPVARDLRQISAALKMITDLERIGDQAEDIAEIITFLEGHWVPGQELIREMALGACKMVTDSVDAYVKKDLELAGAVIAYDDRVDDCFCRVKERLIQAIAADPAQGEWALDLLMIAKYFERIGDHAVNLAQWVRFSISGRHEDPAGET